MTTSHRLAAAALATLWAVPPAMADVIFLPAVSFVLRTSSGSSDLTGESGNGILQNAKGKFYAAVDMPASATNVCRFALVYRDFDVNDITARLLRKSYAVGGSAFTPSFEMALAKSSGAVDAVRRDADNTIRQREIGRNRTFYMVEIDMPDQALQAIGVEVSVAAGACP